MSPNLTCQLRSSTFSGKSEFVNGKSLDVFQLDSLVEIHAEAYSAKHLSPSSDLVGWQSYTACAGYLKLRRIAISQFRQVSAPCPASSQWVELLHSLLSKMLSRSDCTALLIDRLRGVLFWGSGAKPRTLLQHQRLAPSLCITASKHELSSFFHTSDVYFDSFSIYTRRLLWYWAYPVTLLYTLAIFCNKLFSFSRAMNLCRICDREFRRKY